MLRYWKDNLQIVYKNKAGWSSELQRNEIKKGKTIFEVMQFTMNKTRLSKLQLATNKIGVPIGRKSKRYTKPWMKQVLVVYNFFVFFCSQVQRIKLKRNVQSVRNTKQATGSIIQLSMDGYCGKCWLRIQEDWHWERGRGGGK